MFEQKYVSLRVQDNFIYDEIFCRNLYAVKQEELKDRIVIDIGANVGMFSLLAMECGAKKIIAVEPEDNNHEKLLQNIKTFDSNNIIIPIHEAVTTEDGKLSHITKGLAGLSKLTENEDDQIVTTVTLARLVQLYAQNETKLVLKVDCEGSEYPIMLNADTNLLKQFEHIYIEIHDDEEHSVEGLVSYIKVLGYTLESVGEFYNYFPDKPREINPNKIYKFTHN